MVTWSETKSAWLSIVVVGLLICCAFAVLFRCWRQRQRSLGYHAVRHALDDDEERFREALEKQGSFLDELDDVFTEDELDTLGQLEVSQDSIDAALREVGEFELTEDYYEDEGLELRRRVSSLGAEAEPKARRRVSFDLSGEEDGGKGAASTAVPQISLKVLS